MTGTTCPQCARPVAAPGPRCLYCGAPLPQETVTAPAAAEPAISRRTLVILELEGAPRAALRDALSLSEYDASQLGRRGGLHLLRALEDAFAADTEVARLATAGLRAIAIPEADAQPRVQGARSGHREKEALVLVTGEHTCTTIEAAELVLIVRGPVAREYQHAGPAGNVIAWRNEARQLRTATLEQGYRFHLHLRKGGVVELDPGDFAFDDPPTAGSSFLEMASWIEGFSAGVPVDDSFHRLPPALAPAEDPGRLRGALAADGRRSAGGRRPGSDGPVILDNVAQFRAYSGWRGAVARARSAGSGVVLEKR